MKTFVKCFVLICGAILGLGAFSFSQTMKTVDYPEGYRRWVHVKSAVVGPEHPNKRYAGIHHIYANSQAMEGYKTGHFPDGAVIVFDLLEAPATNNGLITEGGRRFIDVMQKDSKRFKETGGWEFEEFRGDSHTDRVLSEEQKTACSACHAGQKQNDFVFSHFRE